MDHRHRQLERTESFRELAWARAREGRTDEAYQIMVAGLDEQRDLAQRALAQVGKIPGADIEAALAALQQATAEHEDWAQAGSVIKGAEVTLGEPGKGRGQWRKADGGGAVPPGTSGLVSWIGARQNAWGRSQERALVRVEKSRGFYAPVSNLRVVDPWGAMLVVLEERELEAAALPGDQVRHRHSGRTGVVNWVGKDEKGKRRRASFLPDDPQPDDTDARWGNAAGKKIVWTFLADLEVMTSWEQLDA